MNALKKIKICTAVEMCAAGILLVYFYGSDVGEITRLYHWHQIPLVFIMGTGIYQMTNVHKFQEQKERKKYLILFFAAIGIWLVPYFWKVFPDQKICLLFAVYAIGAEIYKYKKFSRPETFL